MTKNKRSKKALLINAGFIIFSLAFFGVFSQLYSPEDQIFITDSYFITPKSQPIHFVLMWFATILAILFAIWLGKAIAFFLWTRGLLFLVVGVFMMLGAGVLGYVSLVLQTNVDGIGSMIVMGVIVLFIGGLGAMMAFSSIANFGKKK